MKRLLIISAILLAGALFVNFLLKKPVPLTNGEENVQIDFPIRFMSKPPIELQEGANPIQLATFAWEEFFALNWRSSYNKNGLRDNPDTTWTWDNNTQPFPDLAVWETYAHRTELRPAHGRRTRFDKPPTYSFKKGPRIPPGVSFTLFNNLDENNEIGSCDVYARVNSYQEQYRVLYQAKCNRDEYEYIFYTFPDDQALTNATLNNKTNIRNYNDYYPGANGNTCNCPSTYKILCLPCGNTPNPFYRNKLYTGAMEVKTAWRSLTPQDDVSKFFTRTVLLYEKEGDSTVALNKTYALIGLHIIHKTANYPNFIFATWEHVDVEQSNMGYIELDTGGNEIPPLVANYKRLHPIDRIIDQSTAAAHKLLKEKNPNSIWQNYRLVGVQGTPTSSDLTPSFFLANYVVESDSTLADFHGSGFANPHDKGVNNLYRGRRYSVGGCQGCHGVAQISFGTDLSFLMDNAGKPVDQPDPGLGPNKLARYLKAFREIENMLPPPTNPTRLKKGKPK